jgi:hypothetical protein
MAKGVHTWWFCFVLFVVSCELYSITLCCYQVGAELFNLAFFYSGFFFFVMCVVPSTITTCNGV